MDGVGWVWGRVAEVVRWAWSEHRGRETGGLEENCRIIDISL